MGGFAHRSLLLAALSSLSFATCAQAHKAGAISFNLPSQGLGASLRAVATRAHLNITAPAVLVDARQAPPLQGDYTAPEAIDRLLKGSGLRAEQAGATVIIKADMSPQAGAGQADAGHEGELLITGSRIRGAPIASIVLRTSQEDIRNLGRTDLGQVVRDIPQNFGGGQNPGVGQGVPSASGANIGAGSALNLRGLGSDATLTLLNGHRLAYTAVFQSVDVSAIPIDILDHIEIVPDGASALYGSDAIAGVANIVLRRDFDGFELSSSLGKATDGGDFTQNYGALAGRTWRNGGLVGAVQYGRNSAIRSEQRVYARDIAGLSLFPAVRQVSGLITAHQALGSGLTFSVDALYNTRTSSNNWPFVPPDDPSSDRGIWHTRDRSVAVAPELVYAAGPWRVRISGSYGREKVDYGQTECQFASCRATGSGFYRNREYSGEVGGDGDLFRWTAGTAKLAVGGGFRTIGFERFAGATAINLNTRHGQEDYYAFGELSLPLIGPANALPFLRHAEASAAARYERYPGIGQIVRPKLGLILGPTDDFDLKFNWGKSFRAPTLYEQYQPRSVYLFRPAFVGGSGAGKAVLLELGGNPTLKPERATTFSTTFDLHPRDSRIDIAASYFRVAYTDRIVTPIRYLANALKDPAYAAQVVRNPGAAASAAAIASGATFLNATGAAYDPANVIAIVDNANVNAGRVDVRGLDLLARYRLPIGSSEALISGDVSYIASSRRLTPQAAIDTLAGTIFNPPHWRGRGTATWRAGPLTLTGELNYAGGVRDIRAQTPVSVKGMTTTGLTARYLVQTASRWLDGLDLTLSAQNLLNARPGVIARTSPEDTPYDSTNYSGVGRFLSITVRKAW